jgi:hypothetical protein
MLDELMVSLMAWIAVTTDLPIADPPELMVGATTVRPSLSPLAPHLLALYDEDTCCILLARDWDETDPIDQSVLLHALLHHVQASAAAPHRDDGTREAEAYRLQALWLSQQGIDFYQAFGASPTLLARLGLCSGEPVVAH